MSVISKLTGGDAEHNANIAQGLSTKYNAQAAGGYDTIGQQGQAQTGVYNANYLNLLNQFGGYAGLGQAINSRPMNIIGTQTGSGFVPGSILPNGTVGQSPEQQFMARPQDALAQNLNGQNGQNPQADPYKLDQYQQQQLNQSMTSLAQSHRAATSSFQEQMQQHGITDPRALAAGTEAINNHFADLKAKTETSYYEQIKNDKEQALQFLIAQMSGYGTQGIQNQEFATSGYGSLSGAQQATALTQQQNAQEQLGGTLQLLAQAGAFGKYNKGIGS